MAKSRPSTRMPGLVWAIALMATLGSVPARPARAAATLVVTTTADTAPPCPLAAYSLRCAITQASADGSGDTIAFSIPPTDAGCAGTPRVCMIQPRAALPDLTASSTLVDGYSQAGASPNTNALSAGDNAVLTIRLDGSLAGQGVDGLVLLGTSDTARGLSITGFQTCYTCGPIPGIQTGGAGVRVNGLRDTVAGNFLGVLPDGRTAGANQFAGVNLGPAQFASTDVPARRKGNATSNGLAHVAGRATSDGPAQDGGRAAIAARGVAAGGASIGGTTPAASNVLSGNSDCVGGTCEGFGVYVNAGSGIVIARNYIGTTVAGTVALTNSATGVVIVSPNNTLGSTTAGAGNIISGNGGNGVLIGASGVRVVGNRIGTTAAGTAALGNASHGLDVQGPNATVRHNVISANGDTGLVLETMGNVVQGNEIGTDAGGSVALGNGFHPSANLFGQPINGTDGVVVCAGPNTIGGATAGTGNLISANAGDGIALVSDGNTVQGNKIGTDASGTAALANGVDGIGSRSFIFKGVGFCQQAPDNGASNNTIGGAAAGAGNLISGNTNDGVDLIMSDGNVVAGNSIGTTAAGTGALGNGNMGVVLGAFCDHGVCQGSSSNTIGGTASGAGNVIGANGANGIHIDGTGSGASNSVQGNAIGINATHTIALGNGGNGVALVNSAVNDAVGGSAGGASNTIADNAGAGVLVGASASDTGTHSPINQNAIFANGGLGIDLAPRGAVNCATAPPGPNDYAPCPAIASATTAQVSGTACAGCTVEVYVASNEADDQGHGEGQTFLGSATASIGGAWSLTLAAGQISVGQQVTASATTPASFQVSAETSEFAANVTVSS